ncbi:MAG: aminotransferase class III-fold pyridoxal phosphate-dependent enzyme [Spirochaetes bacterium]|jgi:acetylornithine/succinyldiaminopimelate/putrescine aminotransferase|nr:aminotransferase class III-fold pyridoxal phosphate-dependent enzyme [Spirochaetota bacterium]
MRAKSSGKGAVLGRGEKKRIEEQFARHINRGQVKYLKAGHLDVLETMRRGIRFTDEATGRTMIDCFTSAGCFNVGRGNPVVLAALEKALDSLDMGSWMLLSPWKAALARELVEVAPRGLDRVFFASGGGDAIDCAIKLARGATGRPTVISTVKAYHGHTGFALSANGKEHYRRYFEPLMPGFRFVPFNDSEAIASAVDEKTAAVIIEPIQGEAGIFAADDEYLRELRRLCDRHGALLIFDEVQTGFCRTGRFFACEHSRVVPDIMALAKSIGGGVYPNGAVLYRGLPVINRFLKKHHDFHTSYNGGSDIGCCVSLAVIRFMRETRLWEKAERSGARLYSALEDIRRENPAIIREVRGLGLMIGIEYIHEFMGPMMSDALAKNGVFAAYSGNAPQVMRFMPPLVASDEDIDEIIAATRAAVGAMKSILPIALPAARVPFLLNLLNNERVQTLLFNWLRSAEDLVERIPGLGGRNK